jgi:3-polyprenyl-4-hydroxybenzoate decarboxylase
VTGPAKGAAGLGSSQVTFLKRENPASWLATVRPCSMASAASCASGIRFDLRSWSTTSEPRIAMVRIDTGGTQTWGGVNQASTKLQARAGDMGVETARGFVLILRKAPTVAQAMPRRSPEPSRSPSHCLDRS